MILEFEDRSTGKIEVHECLGYTFEYDEDGDAVFGMKDATGTPDVAYKVFTPSNMKVTVRNSNGQIIDVMVWEDMDVKEFEDVAEVKPQEADLGLKSG